MDCIRAGLVANGNAGPHLLLFPEKPFERKTFIAALSRSVAKHGYAVVVASEGFVLITANFYPQPIPPILFPTGN